LDSGPSIQPFSELEKINELAEEASFASKLDSKT